MDIDSDPYTRCQEELGRRIFDKVLHQPYRKPDFTWFGEWHWNIKLTKQQQKEAMAILRPAYEKGYIRYACVNSYYEPTA